ncbi:MAG: nitronate monooxygenase, partial [Pseudomonadota bacterium]
PVGFQFGTRPLITAESPISEAWKQRLLALENGDVSLNKFSPTGFYSSAIRNPFLEDLHARSERQVAYSAKALGAHDTALPVGARGRPVYVTADAKAQAEGWIAEGYTDAMKTPDSTMVFVTPEDAQRIHRDQVDCMGCLSQCGFSNWSQEDPYTTGKRADPRSYCIQKTLQRISHSDDVDDQLMFAGHNAFRFKDDPFYANGYVPTVKELVERICEGR